MKKIYYCKHCQSSFDYLESESHQSDGGEFWGSQSYITFYSYHCPICGSEHCTTISTSYIERVIDGFFEKNKIGSEEIEVMDKAQLEKLKDKIEEYLDNFIAKHFNGTFSVDYKVDDDGYFEVYSLHCDC